LGKDEIIDFLLAEYSDTKAVSAWGESSIFYNPNNRLPRGVYFATLKDKDGENDRASSLNREGVFRFNIGTIKELYQELIGPLPARPPKGGVIDGRWDFSTLDQIMPHPIYGWMGWVSVNNPSNKTFLSLRPVVDAAYEKAVLKFEKRFQK